MGPRLVHIGLIILVGAACLLVADALGWVRPETTDVWVTPLAGGGVLGIVAGLAAGLLARLSRWVQQTKCVRCGATTERGQTYCLDHMQAALNEYRDHARTRDFRRQ